MNIRRLEVLAMSALFLLVLAALPLWQHIVHLTRAGACGHMSEPAMQFVNFTLAAELRGLPRLLIGILIIAFVVSLLMKCCKMKKECAQKEMYTCATCSTPYEHGSKFCHSCGAEL